MNRSEMALFWAYNPIINIDKETPKQRIISSFRGMFTQMYYYRVVGPL